jgi:hypothetical protein
MTGSKVPCRLVLESIQFLVRDRLILTNNGCREYVQLPFVLGKTQQICCRNRSYKVLIRFFCSRAMSLLACKRVFLRLASCARQGFVSPALMRSTIGVGDMHDLIINAKHSAHERAPSDMDVRLSFVHIGRRTCCP